MRFGIFRILSKAGRAVNHFGERLRVTLGWGQEGSVPELAGDQYPRRHGALRTRKRGRMSRTLSHKAPKPHE